MPKTSRVTCRKQVGVKLRKEVKQKQKKITLLAIQEPHEGRQSCNLDSFRVWKQNETSSVPKTIQRRATQQQRPTFHTF